MQVDDLKKAIASLQNKVAPIRPMAESNSTAISLYDSGSPNSRFWMAQESSYIYLQEWMRKGIRDKVFLDCTCGAGERVISAANWGASLAIGLNQDEVVVSQAKNRARKNRLEDTTVFLQSQPENTGLPSESVDLIVIDDFQMKPDFSFAFPELRRVLKPGGKILFLGTLDCNPFVKVQSLVSRGIKRELKRMLVAPGTIDFAQKFFQIGEIKYWHLLSTSVAYISNFKVQSRMLSILNPLDHYLAKIPGIRRLAWQFTLELRKIK